MNVRLFNRLLNLNFNEILERAFVKFKFICEKLRRASSRVEKNPPIPHTEHPALNKGRCAAQWKLSVNSAIFCWRFRISGREKQRMEGEKTEKKLIKSRSSPSSRTSGWFSIFLINANLLSFEQTHNFSSKLSFQKNEKVATLFYHVIQFFRHNPPL